MVIFAVLTKVLSANYSCNAEVHVHLAELMNFSPTNYYNCVVFLFDVG